jgi:acetyl-CoA acetyltransferase
VELWRTIPNLLANLPEKIPAKFVDQQCGSGMACIHFGFLEIAAGFSDIVMIGGMEHMIIYPALMWLAGFSGHLVRQLETPEKE